eukprot:gene4194-8339_t
MYYDKKSSIYKWRRVPEKWHHKLALFGGWFGGELAMQWMTHKTSKKSFLDLYSMNKQTNIISVVMMSLISIGFNSVSRFVQSSQIFESDLFHLLNVIWSAEAPKFVSLA